MKVVATCDELLSKRRPPNVVNFFPYPSAGMKLSLSPFLLCSFQPEEFREKVRLSKRLPSDRESSVHLYEEAECEGRAAH